MSKGTRCSTDACLHRAVSTYSARFALGASFRAMKWTRGSTRLMLIRQLQRLECRPEQLSTRSTTYSGAAHV